MAEQPVPETDDFLAAMDDLDIEATVNAAFVIEVSLDHGIERGKDEKDKAALSLHPDSDFT